MNVRATLAALAVAGTMSCVTSQANALVLVAGTGWVAGFGHGAECIRRSDSPVTFTVASGQHDIFSLTDAFVPGDVYSVTVGGVTTISTFTSYPGTFPLGLGASPSTYDAAWANNTYQPPAAWVWRRNVLTVDHGRRRRWITGRFCFSARFRHALGERRPRAVNLGHDDAGFCGSWLHGVSAEACGTASLDVIRPWHSIERAAFERPFLFAIRSLKSD